MYIILILIISILSAIFSFLTAGIEQMFNLNKTWYDIPLGYFLIFYFFMFLLIFKIKFKRIKVLKIYLLRYLLILNKMFNKIDKKVSYKIEITSLQERSIELWGSLLKDKLTLLNSSISSQTRMITKDSLTIILKSGQEKTISLIDTGDVKIFYEVFIPESLSRDMENFFDKEIDKRISLIENNQRSEIEKVIKIKIQ